MSREEEGFFGIDKLNIVRSTIPAVTHIDYSARVQTVDKDTSPRFYKLIKAFKRLTGCPVIINTSFNVRGEPIVCKPEEAYTCFMRTHMDYLIMGNYILSKESQKPLEGDSDWQKQFELD
jgi:carbamoyltransferase